MTRMKCDENLSRALRSRVAVPGAILVCLATAALAAAPANPGASTRSDAAGLQAGLDAVVAAGAPGAILFVRNGSRTIQLAAGLSNIAQATPMRARDHFKIASVTKTYTATVVLQLVS
jgi:D-alanyl-D-alanine carboxypeptidase